MDEPKELKQAKELLKKASNELAEKNKAIDQLNEGLKDKDTLISDLTAKQEKMSKEFKETSEELKQIKQESRDVVLKKQIEAEEKLGILDVSPEQRLDELRELDEKGGFELVEKQSQKMLELHKGIGERKTLVNNSNQKSDLKSEIASALGFKQEA